MRKLLAFALATIALVIPMSVVHAGLFDSNGCPSCQPEKKSWLVRMNEFPAFKVLCPGTQMSLVDRIRFKKNCSKVSCEKCECSKNWLCKPKYIRYCSEIHCPYCAPVDEAPDTIGTPPAPAVGAETTQQLPTACRIRIVDLADE